MLSISIVVFVLSIIRALIAHDRHRCAMVDFKARCHARMDVAHAVSEVTKYDRQRFGQGVTAVTCTYIVLFGNFVTYLLGLP